MNDIAERNIKLVYRVVNLHFGGNPDLYDVGMIGLVKGAKSYDPTKNKEANYLCKCIKNEILLFLRKEKNRIKPISLSTTICDEITVEDTVESNIDVEDYSAGSLNNENKQEQFRNKPNFRDDDSYSQKQQSHHREDEMPENDDYGKQNYNKEIS